MEDKNRVLHPARVIIGHCPECGELHVIPNNFEAWPPVGCRCGWADATGGLLNQVRLERRWGVEVNGRTEHFPPGLEAQAR